MPSADTFSMPPVCDFLSRWCGAASCIVDPFARNSTLGTIRNDLNPNTDADYHMQADDFLFMLADMGVVADVVLIDPPYSPRQVSECYRAAGLTPSMKDTQNAAMMKRCREGVEQIVGDGSIVLSFGWNTTGMGKAWETKEILIVSHGGAHNDTLCTAQCKPAGLFSTTELST